LIVHILPLSKDPQPDEAEFNAFFPSKFSLSQFTSPKSDLADADYPQPYRGSRRILVICTDERYLKMENGTLFSTGNHVDDQPGEKGRCFETGLAIRFNAQPCSALPRNLCSRDPGKLDSWIRDAVNSGLVAVERFARVLHRDLDAVYNAIELSWSNGRAEGKSTA
jgi:hypothetical protein